VKGEKSQGLVVHPPKGKLNTEKSASNNIFSKEAAADLQPSKRAFIHNVGKCPFSLLAIFSNMIIPSFIIRRHNYEAEGITDAGQ